MEEKKRGILARCLGSFAGIPDEIIVIKDNSTSQYRKLNIGMNMARQPYVLIANDDTIYDRGNLEDLCIPNTVTKPLLNGSGESGWAHCYCIPMEVYKKLGGFDDSYEHGYFDDNDLEFSLREINVPITLVSSVSILHPDMHGTTLSRIPMYQEFMDRNREKFLKKWGRLP